MKMKNNQVLLIITSVICLLPLLLSLMLYKDLPNQIAVHWNNANEPDGFMPKALAAFGLPFLFFAINIYSKMRLFNDPKRANNEHSQAMHSFSTWTPPILSLILVPITLFIALDIKIPITLISSIILGLVFVLVGNYLPKCRQNYTIGIKLPWTLHNVDNWNKTHRMAGHLWMFGGLVIIATTFLSISKTVLSLSIPVLVTISLFVLPTIYSYYQYTFNKKGD